MKNVLKGAAVIILAVTLASFTSLKSKKVDVKESKISWIGYKVTGQHEGTITLKEGNLDFNGKTLAGGSFVIDMTTISSTDLEGEWKAKLDGHLKADDFFGSEKFPTASLVFTSVKSNGVDYDVTGDLTIKGIKKPVSFKMTALDGTAKAALKIDRTKYDIKYGSASFFDNLQDKAIYDEFDINVSLKY